MHAERILAVADALEELTSHRVSREAFPLKQALDEIKSSAWIQV